MTTDDQPNPLAETATPASTAATAATAAITPQSHHDKIISLVVDSAPILKATPLAHLAEKFYTIPEVVAEIRDQRSREYMAILPFNFQIKTPSEEAIKAVVAFAKKTGDYATLSVVDLKLLALVYMLEVEANGTARLRTEPVKAITQQGAIRRQPHQSSPAATKSTASTTIISSNATSEMDGGPESVDDAVAEVQRGLKALTTEETVGVEVAPGGEIKVTDEQLGEGGHDEGEDGDEGEEESGEEEDIVANEQESVPPSVDSPVTLAQNEDVEEEEEEDGGGWITPDNVHRYKAASYGQTVDSKKKRQPVTMKVACMTADYTMQNVLLQMRLNLLSTDGMRIKNIKTWVMRCHACFHVTSDMEKKFCPRCGNSTLMRTSCSTDENGKVTYYLKKNFQYNNRGTKYAIPNPVGGRKTNDIILREDQREYQKALKGKRAQKAVDVFDPDYMPTFGDLGRAAPNNNMYGSTLIGYGRKNPNVAKRSSGRRKK